MKSNTWKVDVTIQQTRPSSTTTTTASTTLPPPINVSSPSSPTLVGGPITSLGSATSSTIVEAPHSPPPAGAGAGSADGPLRAAKDFERLFHDLTHLLAQQQQRGGIGVGVGSGGGFSSPSSVVRPSQQPLIHRGPVKPRNDLTFHPTGLTGLDSPSSHGPLPATTSTYLPSQRTLDDRFRNAGMDPTTTSTSGRHSLKPLMSPSGPSRLRAGTTGTLSSSVNSFGRRSPSSQEPMPSSNLDDQVGLTGSPDATMIGSTESSRLSPINTVRVLQKQLREQTALCARLMERLQQSEVGRTPMTPEEGGEKRSPAEHMDGQLSSEDTSMSILQLELDRAKAELIREREDAARRQTEIEIMNDSLRNEVNRLHMELSASTQKVAEQQRQIETLVSEQNHSRVRVRDLEDAHQKSQAELAQLQSLVNEKQSQLQTLLQQQQQQQHHHQQQQQAAPHPALPHNTSDIGKPPRSGNSSPKNNAAAAAAKAQLQQQQKEKDTDRMFDNGLRRYSKLTQGVDSQQETEKMLHAHKKSIVAVSGANIDPSLLNGLTLSRRHSMSALAYVSGREMEASQALNTFAFGSKNPDGSPRSSPQIKVDQSEGVDEEEDDEGLGDRMNSPVFSLSGANDELLEIKWTRQDTEEGAKLHRQSIVAASGSQLDPEHLFSLTFSRRTSMSSTEYRSSFDSQYVLQLRVPVFDSTENNFKPETGGVVERPAANAAPKPKPKANLNALGGDLDWFSFGDKTTSVIGIAGISPRSGATPDTQEPSSAGSSSFLGSDNDDEEGEDVADEQPNKRGQQADGADDDVIDEAESVWRARKYSGVGIKEKPQQNLNPEEAIAKHRLSLVQVSQNPALDMSQLNGVTLSRRHSMAPVEYYQQYEPTSYTDCFSGYKFGGSPPQSFTRKAVGGGGASNVVPASMMSSLIRGAEQAAPPVPTASAAALIKKRVSLALKDSAALIIPGVDSEATPGASSRLTPKSSSPIITTTCPSFRGENNVAVASSSPSSEGEEGARVGPADDHEDEMDEEEHENRFMRFGGVATLLPANDRAQEHRRSLSMVCTNNNTTINPELLYGVTLSRRHMVSQADYTNAYNRDFAQQTRKYSLAEALKTAVTNDVELWAKRSDAAPSLMEQAAANSADPVTARLSARANAHRHSIASFAISYSNGKAQVDPNSLFGITLSRRHTMSHHEYQGGMDPMYNDHLRRFSCGGPPPEYGSPSASSSADLEDAHSDRPDTLGDDETTMMQLREMFESIMKGIGQHNRKLELALRLLNELSNAATNNIKPASAASVLVSSSQ